MKEWDTSTWVELPACAKHRLSYLESRNRLLLKLQNAIENMDARIYDCADTKCEAVEGVLEDLHDLITDWEQHD